MNSVAKLYRVLVIDDMPSIHDDFRKILTPSPANSPSSVRITSLANAIFGEKTTTTTTPTIGNFSVDSALQGEEGLALVIDALAKGQPYAVAFVDMRLPPGWDGLETIRHLWAADPEIQVVICTAYSDHSWAAISDRIGQSDNLLILKKPFDHIEVLQLAHSLTHKWQLARDNEANLHRLDDLIAKRNYQLSEAEERFTEAFNASPLAQAIIDLDENHFLSINNTFEKQFNVSRSTLDSITPQTFCPALNAAAWAEFVEHLRAGQPIDERPFIYKNALGKERHMRCSARAVPLTTHACAILVLRDVTEQLETERQLRQSQKLEAVGQLSAGIAHDFNNLLTVIHCYTAELLASHTDPAMRQMLEPVQAAASRAAALVRQLLIFSRKEAIRPIKLDFINVTSGLQPLIRRLIGTNIAIDWSVPKELPQIEADPANLEQIIVNLVVNARDAMPDGGRITISAEQFVIANTDTATTPESSPGCYLVVKVTDTGTGISPEVLPRIFEPFFTTKEAGKGTGLGLSTVYSLVKQHKGWIQVDSILGKGTTFTLFHPVAAAQSTTVADPPDPQNTAGGLSSAKSSHRILVVDDDPAIQRMLGRLLERYNINHLVVPDGVAALSVWKDTPEPFDILISDIVMPNGVSGLQLAHTLRENNPKLAVILISGYSEALANPKALELPGGKPKFLYKPFNLDALRTAINEALQAVR